MSPINLVSLFFNHLQIYLFLILEISIAANCNLEESFVQAENKTIYQEGLGGVHIQSANESQVLSEYLFCATIHYGQKEESMGRVTSQSAVRITLRVLHLTFKSGFRVLGFEKYMVGYV